VNVSSTLPNGSTQDWPLGDRNAVGPIPSEVNAAALNRALDWAMAQSEQNTRAIVVIYKGGKVLSERYAPGFTKDTPQISWSMGKSITSALIGVLVQQGRFHWNDAAPVSEWSKPGDPRSQITIAHLLRMSSGLDFKNYGLSGPESYSPENEHFLIYFGAPHVFRHAVNQPAAFAPDVEWRYKNSDPLTLGKIVRETVEARGENLETDAYGNFIMTGCDFGSGRDWARFGLLHLWDGVFEGERVLPEGWVDFITTPALADNRQGYGGLWWLNRGGAMNRAPEDAYWAAGYMGQRTMVIPSRDMVIVRLGPSASGFRQYFNTFVGEVLEAVAREP